MTTKLRDKLKNKMNGERKIFVLKGFNSILPEIDLNLEHIFDLNLKENLLDLTNVDTKQLAFDAFQKLSNSKSYYCLYEEIVFLEKNGLIGIVQANNYKLIIIDIGCFNYYYPSFKVKNGESYLKAFDENLDESNYIQKLYTEFSVIDNNTLIAYNKIETEEICEFVNLIDSYTEDYSFNQYQEIRTFELIDNSSNEIYIKVFNNVASGLFNQIVYKKFEDKQNPQEKKFLYTLNLMGANIKIDFLKINYNKSPYYDEYLKILKRIDNDYGFKNICIYEDPFRSTNKIEISQDIVIDRIYQNILKAQNKEDFKDVFVTAPTGAGKSVLFQIPAIMAAEKNNLVTIVISPLIGLMKDQVNNIKRMTDVAETINSEYTPFQKELVKEKIKDGRKSILYISPETLLGNNDISTFVGDRKIGLLVVDEAHTVATWGKNFRPDYWYLGDYIDKLRHRSGYSFPIATFTATATIGNGDDDMYHDIIESLNMTCDAFFGNVKREDITFDINLCKVDHAYREEKEKIVIKRIKNYINLGEKTLVYFPYVKTLNEIYGILPKENVGRYYGQLDKLDKDATLEDIRFGTKKVVLATKAFGMGIDVKDIKNVYHFAPTGNLADYVQEIGRAARDPKIKGVASTDYFENDFRYINQLYGISQITNYNILSVLRKIDYKYKKENRRNFLVSTEDFAHIFSAEKEDEIENKLKATIIAIKKDFKGMSNFVPLIFKPRGMFTKGLFYIPDAKLSTVLSYGWGKYLKKEYSGEQLNKQVSSTKKILYMGDVYSFNFKKCWEENYNGKYDGITFGQFKRNFYNGELQGIDRSCFLDRMVLTLESKYGNNFDWVLTKTINSLNLLKISFDNLKMANKWYTSSEIADCLYEKGIELNKTKLRNVIEPLINLLISFETNVSFGKRKFCQYNSKTDRYHIDSPYYDRVINNIKEAINSYLNEHKGEKIRVSLVDTSKNNKMRNDPLLVGVQIMELLDFATYTFEAGSKPEFFIRINSEKTILDVINNNNYQSRTLASIQALHYNSVRYMKYFFEKLNNDKDRWQFIEDYFLGRIEENYDIGYYDTKSGLKSIDKTADKNRKLLEETKQNLNKRIKVYYVYHQEDNLNENYYISKDKIENLENKKFHRLSPDCEVARQLLSKTTGDVFEINGYQYLIEKIEVYDV